ncbi:MAG: putative cyclin B [Streblomastix strix]|uniref:Putative cyclin B n=1 Tax=Streblomastix strix TaxID=222440 RepID=A0A5J4WG43_9EUKA|nr:MAG: putative cyclin B [Streblomastix strix]
MQKPRGVLSNITNISSGIISAKEAALNAQPVSRPITVRGPNTERVAQARAISAQPTPRDLTTAESATPITEPPIPPYLVPINELAEDIDFGDETNENLCSCYANDIYAYLKELEMKLRVAPNYMQIQPHITPRLRAYCVDWQVQMHRHLSQMFEKPLQIDTLFLSIHTLDRFLSRKIIAADKLHLVGLGCFYVASKFEETYYPSIDQLLKFVPNVGKKDDIIRMERVILNELKYTLGAPTSLIFLKRYAKAAHADQNIGMLSRFMSEYALSNYSISSNYLPSVIAASATAHALRIVGRQPWTATLQKYTGYTFEDLRACMTEMRDIIKKAPILKTQAIYRKYADQKYLKAAVTAVQQGVNGNKFKMNRATYLKNALKSVLDVIPKQQKNLYQIGEKVNPNQASICNFFQLCVDTGDVPLISSVIVTISQISQSSFFPELNPKNNTKIQEIIQSAQDEIEDKDNQKTKSKETTKKPRKQTQDRSKSPGNQERSESDERRPEIKRRLNNDEAEKFQVVRLGDEKERGRSNKRSKSRSPSSSSDPGDDNQKDKDHFEGRKHKRDKQNKEREQKASLQSANDLVNSLNAPIAPITAIPASILPASILPSKFTQTQSSYNQLIQQANGSLISTAILGAKSTVGQQSQQGQLKDLQNVTDNKIIAPKAVKPNVGPQADTRSPHAIINLQDQFHNQLQQQNMLIPPPNLPQTNQYNQSRLSHVQQQQILQPHNQSPFGSPYPVNKNQNKVQQPISKTDKEKQKIKGQIVNKDDEDDDEEYQDVGYIDNKTGKEKKNEEQWKTRRLSLTTMIQNYQEKGSKSVICLIFFIILGILALWTISSFIYAFVILNSESEQSQSSFLNIQQDYSKAHQTKYTKQYFDDNLNAREIVMIRIGGQDAPIYKRIILLPWKSIHQFIYSPVKSLSILIISKVSNIYQNFNQPSQSDIIKPTKDKKQYFCPDNTNEYVYNGKKVIDDGLQFKQFIELYMPINMNSEYCTPCPDNGTCIISLKNKNEKELKDKSEQRLDDLQFANLEFESVLRCKPQYRIIKPNWLGKIPSKQKLQLEEEKYAQLHLQQQHNQLQSTPSSKNTDIVIQQIIKEAGSYETQISTDSRSYCFIDHRYNTLIDLASIRMREVLEYQQANYMCKKDGEQYIDGRQTDNKIYLYKQLDQLSTSQISQSKNQQQQSKSLITLSPENPYIIEYDFLSIIHYQFGQVIEVLRGKETLLKTNELFEINEKSKESRKIDRMLQRASMNFFHYHDDQWKQEFGEEFIEFFYEAEEKAFQEQMKEKTQSSFLDNKNTGKNSKKQSKNQQSQQQQQLLQKQDKYLYQFDEENGQYEFTGIPYRSFFCKTKLFFHRLWKIIMTLLIIIIIILIIASVGYAYFLHQRYEKEKDTLAFNMACYILQNEQQQSEENLISETFRRSQIQPSEKRKKYILSNLVRDSRIQQGLHDTWKWINQSNNFTDSSLSQFPVEPVGAWVVRQQQRESQRKIKQQNDQIKKQYDKDLRHAKEWLKRQRKRSKNRKKQTNSSSSNNNIQSRNDDRIQQDDVDNEASADDDSLADISDDELVKRFMRKENENNKSSDQLDILVPTNGWQQQQLQNQNQARLTNGYLQPLLQQDYGDSGYILGNTGNFQQNRNKQQGPPRQSNNSGSSLYNNTFTSPNILSFAQGKQLGQSTAGQSMFKPPSHFAE